MGADHEREDFFATLLPHLPDGPDLRLLPAHQCEFLRMSGGAVGASFYYAVGPAPGDRWRCWHTFPANQLPNPLVTQADLDRIDSVGVSR